MGAVEVHQDHQVLGWNIWVPWIKLIGQSGPTDRPTHGATCITVTKRHQTSHWKSFPVSVSHSPLTRPFEKQPRAHSLWRRDISAHYDRWLCLIARKVNIGAIFHIDNTSSRGGGGWQEVTPPQETGSLSGFILLQSFKCIIFWWK